MSLRARLLVGMVVLVAAGLAVTAIVTYEEQRSFLLDRVDQQVQSALAPLSFQLRARTAGDGRPPGRTLPQRPPFTRRPGAVGPASALPPGTFGEIISPTGTVLRRRTFSYGERTGPVPTIPARPPLTRPGSALRLFTVSSPSGARYRAAAFSDGSDTAVVAVPLHEVQQTLHRLVIVEALVAGAVILALLALGWFVIRLGLRPLERIGRVASEIAGGDLSRRVATDDERTEVGRLGHSLNEMLTQIESAFAARELSEAQLRRFLADASHELRTPLASIRGYAELFRMGAAEDPETLARAMSRIEGEAARMGVLVEDLLLLAQLDQAPEPRRVPVALGELTAHVAEDTRVIAPDRVVSTNIEQDATVLGDPDQLGQLLANLTRNAVMYTPGGSPIDLSLGRRPGHAVLEVRDHGPGVPEDAGETEQLFERFWRSEGGRSRGRGGSGLGLAIVRAIAHAHGGEVSAANAPGGGARFTVELPLSEPGDLSGKSQPPHVGLLAASPTVAG
jgi:two-component system OmpR family sensor kinase